MDNNIVPLDTRRKAALQGLLEAASAADPEDRLQWAQGVLLAWAERDPKASKRFIEELTERADEVLEARARAAADAAGRVC